MDDLFSRKFLLSLIILGMFFALVVMQLLPVDKFVEWVGVIYGTYVIGNVTSKLAQPIK